MKFIKKINEGESINNTLFGYKYKKIENRWLFGFFINFKIFSSGIIFGYGVSGLFFHYNICSLHIDYCKERYDGDKRKWIITRISNN